MAGAKIPTSSMLQALREGSGGGGGGRETAGGGPQSSSAARQRWHHLADKLAAAAEVVGCRRSRARGGSEGGEHRKDEKAPDGEIGRPACGRDWTVARPV